MSVNSNTYSVCCVSGYKNYSSQYRDCCTDIPSACFPFAGQPSAEIWETEIDKCWTNPSGLECCYNGLLSRALSVVQCVGDSFFCMTTCLPTAVGTPVISGGAGLAACVLCCVASCETAEKQDACYASAAKISKFAQDCCCRGTFFCTGIFLAETRSLGCLACNLLAPELLNMWAFQQEYNLVTHRMMSCDDYYKQYCCKPVIEKAPEPVLAENVTPGGPEEAGKKE